MTDRAAHIRYNKSPLGRARRERDRVKQRIRDLEYAKSPKGHERDRRYWIKNGERRNQQRRVKRVTASQN